MLDPEERRKMRTEVVDLANEITALSAKIKSLKLRVEFLEERLK